MVNDPAASSRGSSTPTALDVVYEEIRGDLLAGHYEPGAKLRIEKLCERYGFGASPIREALSRIAGSGMIVALPQRGYRVATLSRQEYRELIDLRLTLEPEALYRSIVSSSIEWESRVAAAYYRLTCMHKRLKLNAPDGLRNWAREDRNFHVTLISNCGSRWLLRFCGNILEQTARYHRDKILEGVAPVRQTEDEHESLMKAALSHDARRARTLLRAHITNVAQRIERAVWLHPNAGEKERVSAGKQSTSM